MYQDRIIRFLGVAKEWTETTFEPTPIIYSLSTYLGNPSDCILFSRDCDIDEMETEDDERYVFSSPDHKVSMIFSRFETRSVFSKLSPNFTNERIEQILKMAWNYRKLVVNQKTSEYRPFSDQSDKLPPMPSSGGPPIRKVFVD